MFKKAICRFVVILFFVLTMPYQAYGKGMEGHSGGKKLNNDSSTTSAVSFQEVSVHDPSVIKAGDSYYVFGSHIEAAKSTDLINWTKFTNSYTTPGNALYGNLSENLSGAFKWAGENDGDSLGGYAVWAPDVFYNPDYVNKDGTKGAYMDYFCTSSTWKRSVIGYAVSKNIEGPYTFVDTVVYSGFTEKDNYDGKSSNGAITMNNSPTKYSETNTNYANTNISKLVANKQISGVNKEWFNSDGSYNTSLYPNAIDPGIFYDKKGNLWMAYGSWSGGIYLLQINKKTGAAIYPGRDGKTRGGNKIDRYFGIHISGGYGQSGEGPYIVYNKQTGYYYLYETYGGLMSSGGYNMRVFRSKNPDGPYVDASGKNAVLPANTDNENYGNKMMGNFLFQRDVGDPGTGDGYGYVSPGHNSVYYDEKTGEQYLVFHSRFPKTGETHEVRVHKIYMNKDGWPVVAPYRYAGIKQTRIIEKDAVGEYKFINHGKETTSTIKNSVYIRLNRNHTISGDVKGKWKVTGKSRVAITIDGKVYDGVFTMEYNPVTEKKVVTFTAVSKEGVPIWGSKLANETDEQVVNDVYNDLSLGDTDKVIADLKLPAEGTRHTQITWQTSDSSVVTGSGKVTRPQAGSNSATATLTATITKGKVSRTKAFTITVLPYKTAGIVAKYNFENNLNDSAGNYTAGTVIGNLIGTSGGNISYADGKKGEAAVFNGSSGIQLPAGLITSNSYSVAMWLKPQALTLYTTAFFGARDSNNWVSLVPYGPVNNNTMVWSGSTTWYNGTTSLTIPKDEWTHVAFTVANGKLSVYINGELKYSGTDFPDIFTTANCIFTLGVNWWDPAYKGLMDDVRVYEGALTREQVQKLVQ